MAASQAAAKPSLGENLMQGLETMAGGGGGKQAQLSKTTLAEMPTMMRSQAPSLGVDQQGQDMQRQQLAQYMARLNSGRLA